MLKSKSIDFTDVLGDFEIGFLIVCDAKFPYYKLGFVWVRWNALFLRVWGIFGWDSGDFCDVKSDEMLDFVGFCRSGYRSGYFGGFEVKYLGNADFTRSLWVEQMCLVCNRTLVLKM